MQGQSAETTSVAQPKLAGPLYNQIQLLMRERILAQEWREGKTLPTEVELAREYNVSVGTMRKALDVLEDAKFIVRKQGLGTFVRDLNALSGDRPTNWMVDGKVSAERIIKIVSITSGEATVNDCATLDISARSAVHRIKVVSAIANRGMVLDEYVIPEAMGLSTGAHDRDPSGTLHSALQSIERQATRYVESFAVEAATASQAQLLRIDVGIPLLRIERTAVDAKGRPMFLCIRTAHLGGARYKVEVSSH